jgi:hypothetical protein
VLRDVVLRIVVCLHHFVEVDQLLGVREVRFDRGSEYCADLELPQQIYVVSCTEAAQVESSDVVDYISKFIYIKHNTRFNYACHRIRIDKIRNRIHELILLCRIGEATIPLRKNI